MVRISTHNVNGIRAAQRRGLGDWYAQAGDVVALQEVRCRPADLPPAAFGEFHATYEPGELAGRNGVAVLTREAPLRVRTLSGSALSIAPGGDPQPTDAQLIANRELRRHAVEGRYVEVDLADAPLRVASLYLPKGAVPEHHARPSETPDQAKYDRKMRFMAGLGRLLTASRREAAAEGREFLVMGDFNVAHTELDLKNWRTNQRSEGFLPEERDWFGSITSPRTLVDVTRALHPGAYGPYSWWSWRGQAFTTDAGWRIDYHLASPGLARRATQSWVDRAPDYDSRISDHAPVVAEYAL